MDCRFCKTPLNRKLLDLGYAPPSNAYLDRSDLVKPEATFPLRLYVCEKCFLVQTEDYSMCEELFTSDYAYFSSVSSSYLEHARSYCNQVIPLLGLDSESFVVEIASNDGYLLRNFVERGIPCVGIEPTFSTARVAESLGIPVIKEFFGEKFARNFVSNHRQADLIIGNNVYAHVPDINDFTGGLKIALKKGGTITLEFQHLLNMIRLNQFDTVYHEHYSYLSLHFVSRIFEKFKLRVFNVEKISTHGGSLRVYGCHHDDERITSPAVKEILNEEDQGGLNLLPFYYSWQTRVDKTKNELLRFLVKQRMMGRKVLAYGAAAKANTLFNYAGIRADLIPFICDAAASKQGKFLPGSHIPIVPVSHLEMHQPDYILIIPWNIKEEIIERLEFARQWKARFIIAIPCLQLVRQKDKHLVIR
jgi:hypothetical protein